MESAEKIMSDGLVAWVAVFLGAMAITAAIILGMLGRWLVVLAWQAGVSIYRLFKPQRRFQ